MYILSQNDKQNILTRTGIGIEKNRILLPNRNII